METKIELTQDEYKLLQFIGQHVGGRSVREMTEFLEGITTKTYLFEKGLVRAEPTMNGVILYRVTDNGRKLLNQEGYGTEN